MVIVYGDGRGQIGPQGELKVVIPEIKESMWMKVVAKKTDGKAVIGALMNDPLDKRKYRWGDFVMAKEVDPTEIAHVVSKVTKVPNTPSWQIMER